MDFSRVPNRTSIVLFYIKNEFTRDEQFLETFRGEIIPTKKYVMDSYFGSNLQYL